MCGIAGFSVLDSKKLSSLSDNDRNVYELELSNILEQVFSATSERGRASWGVCGYTLDSYDLYRIVYIGKYNPAIGVKKTMSLGRNVNLIANFRGEPTTEIVKKSTYNIQPFAIHNYAVAHNGYAVAHNGIISNDKEILQNGVIQEILYLNGHRGHIIDSYALLELALQYHLKTGTFDIESFFQRIEGSYAVALLLPNKHLLLARNYRDLAVRIINIVGVPVLLFASKPEYLRMAGDMPFQSLQSIPPYSWLYVKSDASEIEDSDYMHNQLHWKQTPEMEGEIISGNISDKLNNKDKAIVVISGGLDSTTSAKVACDAHKEITLLHVLYKCKAETKEVEAIRAIHAQLQKDHPDKKIDLMFFETDLFAKLGGSTITDESMYDQIAEGDKGVETSNEWVPFRNGVLLAIAGAICDRYDIGKIYLGLNMEESGAFEDNTTEFYERYSSVFSIGSHSRPIVVNPLGTLMKHEIVQLAYSINAPIHLSWSCYHNGELSCSKCGPCTMRLKAHVMNNHVETLHYQEYPSWFPPELRPPGDELK